MQCAEIIKSVSISTVLNRSGFVTQVNLCSDLHISHAAMNHELIHDSLFLPIYNPELPSCK